ncbi:MAG: non-heme iron oxygenase ferredoxin subunit [Candidatus Moranbacteria bacterium]|nr:non-heme iron oxygenase ferredoxin subunit [Candidatus Moranbacteria bacterium]
MLYEKVAQISELKSGEKKKVSLNQKDILLVNIDDVIYAVDNKCPHMGASLVEGTLNGSQIICPKHGSAFDVKTGKVVQSGKILFINVNPKNLNVYQTKIENDDILPYPVP